MPLREPRLELDRQEINDLLGWSGASIYNICSFIRNIPVGSNIHITGTDVFVYNRGESELEDTERRSKTCYMISIWSSKIDDSDSECLFQQPVPIKLRFYD